MLTLKKLKSFGHHETIAEGIVIDSAEGVNVTNSGKNLKWVAVSGLTYHDWTIYCHFAIHSTEYVKRYGDKILGESNIKKLVTCDAEAYEMYRF